MSRVKIATVSYLNSCQFVYGLEHSNLIDCELTKATPAQCTQLLLDGQVDVALIPVGALPLFGYGTENPLIDIVTSHCIGAESSVRTVVLLSDEEPANIKRIWLDTHSQSSVRLIAHLAEHHLHITPQWHMLDSESRIEKSREGDAFLLIGDKVFDHEGTFEYSFDLADMWHESEGLPFAFAVWCCRKEVDEATVEQLDLALEWGVERTFEALQTLRPDVELEDGYRYLTENIDTILDSGKMEAIERFLGSESKLVITKPGEDIA